MHLVIYDLTKEVTNNPKLLEALYYFVDVLCAGAMRHTYETILLYVAWEKHNFPERKFWQRVLDERQPGKQCLLDLDKLQLVDDVICFSKTKSDYMDLPTT